MRPDKRRHRNHRPTENEIALQWEIDRLRSELRATRKQMEAGGSSGPVSLQGQKKAIYLLKVERIYRRTAKGYIDREHRCPTCGGASWWQLEDAYFKGCRDLPDWKNDLDPSAWRVPDELPHPKFDLARGVVPEGYVPPPRTGYQTCGDEPTPQGWVWPDSWEAAGDAG